MVEWLQTKSLNPGRQTECAEGADRVLKCSVELTKCRNIPLLVANKEFEPRGAYRVRRSADRVLKLVSS